MSSQITKPNEFLNAKVLHMDSDGPCLNALNRYAQMTGQVSFYDHASIHTEQFYLKYSHREWKDQLWRRVDSGEIREFRSSHMQLASQCLYRFQTLCDQNEISTRNPISFFDSLSKFMGSEGYDYSIASAVFLYAAADRDFLFDCSVVNHMPAQFVTRAFISEFESALDFADFTNRPDTANWAKVPRTQEELDHVSAVLQGQVRDFHLFMAPSRNIFYNTWEETILPTVRSIQIGFSQYNEMPYTVNRVPDECLCKQLTETIFNCFIWYVSSKRHLSAKDKENVEITLPYLSNTQRSSTKQAFLKVIEEIVQKHDFSTIPYYVYKVITKKYEKFMSAEAIDTGSILSILKSFELNTTCRSEEATSRKRVRYNLLFFKKLCSELSRFLPNEAITCSFYLFGLSEPITRDRYPDSRLVDLEPENSQIKEYIQKGLHAGDAVLPELSRLLERISFGLQISPFNILQHRVWEATPQSLGEFLYSAKDRSGRGKRTTKKTVIAASIDALNDCNKLKEQYFYLVFKHPSGYGSGIPTYTWAATLAHLIDIVISKSPELKNLCNESALQSEHVELGIHQYFIDWCSERAAQQAAILGKSLL